MPELPEVETFKQFVDRYALHQPICEARVLQPNILKGCTPEAFAKMLQGRLFSRSLRRGKHLFVALKAVQSSQKPLPWVYFHFGMTGYFSVQQGERFIANAYGDPARPASHVRAQFCLESGVTLNFHEQRMFGELGLIDDPAAWIAAKKLGPDALEMEQAAFLTALQARKGTIKPALMDQSLVAGIGNVYADEMLFQCGIHPEARASALALEQQACLYAQLRAVLQAAVQAGADRTQLPPGYQLHRRQPKGRCPVHNAPWAIQPVGGRTTYWCPLCQPLAPQRA